MNKQTAVALVHEVRQQSDHRWCVVPSLLNGFVAQVWVGQATAVYVTL